MKLKFYGASDDLLEVEGGIRDEWDCIDRPCVLEVWSPEKGEGLIVIGEYLVSGNGVWIIGATLLDEEMLLPLWDIKIIREHSYSPGLIIRCPDDVVITERTV